MSPPTKKQKLLNSPATDNDDLCPNLRRSIDRWRLTQPFLHPKENGKWGAYYAERACLEFRDAHVWDSKDEELKKYPKCYEYFVEECKQASVIQEEGSPDRCGNCKKVRRPVVEPTDEMNKAWKKLVESDECLKEVYKDTCWIEQVPFMQPHCTESYARSCHESGTTKGQYDDFLERIRERIETTLSSTKLDKDVAKITSLGLFILSYWVNFDDCAIDADVRTVEFSTRLYSPTGNGKSIDLSWYYHYRMRSTIAPEKHSTLHAITRDFESADPLDPTRTFGGKSALAILDGDTNEEHMRKTFAMLPQLRELQDDLLGGGKISPRKIFAVLARAAGAFIVGKEGGWVYRGMRNRYELHSGEESDGQEDGSEDGPSGCVIS